MVQQAVQSVVVSICRAKTPMMTKALGSLAALAAGI
jgi:hypothetical protein